MKKQFFAKRWILVVGMMTAAAACQPRASTQPSNPNSSKSGYQQDDDGDDGAYGSGDQSTKTFELLDTAPEEAESVAQESPAEPQAQEVSASHEPAQEEKTTALEEQVSTPSLEAAADDVPAVMEIDPRLEAIEAIRIISENYQEISEPSSQN